MKKIIIAISVPLALILLILLVLYIYSCIAFSKINPSTGIWQYDDGYLKITIHIPPDHGISSPPAGYICNAELICNGEKHNVAFIYYTKMSYSYLFYIDEYTDKTNPWTLAIVYSPYTVKRKWLVKKQLVLEKFECKDEEYKDDFADYEGKEIALDRIGDYVKD